MYPAALYYFEIMATTTSKITQTLRNHLNAVLGRKQALLELLTNGDIARLQSKMTNYSERIQNAIKEYTPGCHKVCRRPNKPRKGKPDKETAKLPIPYQRTINEQSTAFLFGSPVQFSNNTTVDGDDMSSNAAVDEAFGLFKQILKDTRFDFTIRTCKTTAGAETLCAKLYHLYLDESDSIQVLTKVLAQSLGDDLYLKKDDFGRLIMFARHFTVKDLEGKDEIHFDVYTDKYIYRCVQRPIGWDVVIEENFIGKIPVLIYEQPVEWDGVQALIERREEIQCKDADMNDYFADPKLVCEGRIAGLPNPDDPGSVIQADGGKAYYLTYDSAPENRKREYDNLDSIIYGMSYSVNPSSDAIKEMKIPSGVSWEYMFMFPLLKAKNHQDRYGEMIDREINLVKAIIGVIRPDLKLSGTLDRLNIAFEFSTPMPNDIAETLNEIQKSIDSGTMSQETAVGLNPLIKSPKLEMERLAQEDDAKVLREGVNPTF